MTCYDGPKAHYRGHPVNREALVAAAYRCAPWPLNRLVIYQLRAYAARGRAATSSSPAGRAARCAMAKVLLQLPARRTAGPGGPG